jgi:hypothetical protein
MAAKDTPTQDQPQDGNGEVQGQVQKYSLVADFHRYMLAMAAQNVADNSERGEEILSQQAEAILTAEGVDAILKADLGGTIQCRDVPGTYWEIFSWQAIKGNRDDIENSHGYYVQFEATCIGGDPDVMAKNGLEVGKQYPLQTSALLLTTKARALDAAQALPIRLALVGFRTQTGNVVLKWGPMPVTVQSAGPSPF